MLCIFLLFACQKLAMAGFGNEEFEEDPSIRQEEDLDWPEVAFPSAEERSRGFKVGEALEYRAQWGIFRKAGVIRIFTESVEDEDRNALQVVTQSASAGLIRRIYPMEMEARTVLDAHDWRALRNEVRGRARSEETDTLTLFDYSRKLMSYEDKTEPERNLIRPIPYDCALDYSSAFLQLRGMDLEIGSKHPIFVSSRSKFYFVILQVVEKEAIKTKLGKIDCMRLEPLSSFPESKLFREGGKLEIWISDDERRIPVRFDVKTPVGTATVRLESYTPPR